MTEGLSEFEEEKDGRCYVWDVATGESARKPIVCGLDQLVSLVRGPRPDEFLAVSPRSASIWNIVSGNQVSGPYPWDPEQDEPGYRHARASADCTCVAIATGQHGADPTVPTGIALWDTKAARRITRPIMHPGAIDSLR